MHFRVCNGFSFFLFSWPTLAAFRGLPGHTCSSLCLERTCFLQRWHSCKFSPSAPPSASLRYPTCSLNFLQPDSDTLELVFKKSVVFRFSLRECTDLGEHCLWERAFSLPLHFHINYIILYYFYFFHIYLKKQFLCNHRTDQYIPFVSQCILLFVCLVISGVYNNVTHWVLGRHTWVCSPALPTFAALMASL